MELSKTYNCFSQDLLITKLEAHGVSKKSSYLIKNYLEYRAQQTKFGST